MKPPWLVPVIAATTVSYACAPVSRIPTVSQAAIVQEQSLQNNLAITNILQQQRDLLHASWSMLRGAAQLCPHKESRLGALLVSEYQLPGIRRHDISDITGGNGLLVVAVAPDSPAWNAGLREGDQLVAVAGVSMSGRQAAGDYYSLLRTFAGGKEVSLEYIRDGVVTAATAVTEIACSYPVVGLSGSSANTYSGDGAVFITRGMMRFARDKNELALAIGHELAHAILHHHRQGGKPITTDQSLVELFKAVGTIHDDTDFSISGNKKHNSIAEKGADYLGLYITALGGYNITGAVDFWRRSGIENNSHASTHKVTATRFTELNMIVAEIQDKIDSGQQLQPDKARLARQR